MIFEVVMSLTEPQFHLFNQFLVRAFYMHGTVLEEIKNVKICKIYFLFS